MSPNVICLGELLVEIMREEVDVPHGEVGERYRGPYPSGAPANFIDSVARMAANLDLTTGYVGAIGDDEFGHCVIQKLKKDGVDTSQIKTLKGTTTGIAFNQYNSDGSRKFIFAPGAAGEISPNDINPSYFNDIKALHIMGSALSISESSKEACYKAIKVAKEANPKVIISFDPNLRPEMLDIEKILEICEPVLKDTTILLPSGEEAQMLARKEHPKEACISLLEKGPEIVVLKQGKEGSTMFTRENPDGIHESSFKVKEIDPTGAGDAFDGAFITGFLANWEPKKILRFANAVGAAKVEFFGPMPHTTYKEVMDMLKK
jgi:sugar/nucleoside kinase (ribokinase family)